MSLLRIVLIVILIYFVYKLLKNFILRSLPKERPSVKGRSKDHIPPPYDPNQVEDIDYKDVKRKHREDT